MLVLAHISDTHFDGGRRSFKRALRVMKYLNELPGRIDAVVVTGDIADRGTAVEYQQARTALRADDLPVLTCPGNHDARETFRSEFLGETGSGPVNRAHVIGNTVIAMCDSSVPGRPDGELTDDTLTWLSTVFADAPADASIVVAFHHPPVRLFSPIVDPIRLAAEHRLADLIAQEPRVAAILCGHAHTASVTTFAGVPLIVGPSVTSVLAPQWEGDGVTHDPVVDYGAPPSLAFHVIDDDGRVTTHFRSLAKPGAGKGRGYVHAAHPPLPT